METFDPEKGATSLASTIMINNVGFLEHRLYRDIDQTNVESLAGRKEGQNHKHKQNKWRVQLARIVEKKQQTIVIHPKQSNKYVLKGILTLYLLWFRRKKPKQNMLGCLRIISSPIHIQHHHSMLPNVWFHPLRPP